MISKPDNNNQKHVQETSDDIKRDEALADEELDNVSGGFNPQPDPPGDQRTNPQFLITVRKAGGGQQE